MPNPLCRVCGLPVPAPSVGGADLCPACDMGQYRDGTRWTYKETVNPDLVRERARERTGLRDDVLQALLADAGIPHCEPAEPAEKEPYDIQVPAEWKDDCQGKKDYDADLVVLSTRYWPRGGGFSIYLPDQGGQWEENAHRPGIKPHARAHILIRGPGHDDRELASAEFTGETFEEIAPQVEAWARATYRKIVAVLTAEFGELKEFC